MSNRGLFRRAASTLTRLVLVRLALNPAERILLAVALAFSIVVLTFQVSGYRFGQAERNESRSVLAGASALVWERAPGALAVGSSLPTPTSEIDNTPRPGLSTVAGLPGWVQAIRETRLFEDATSVDQAAAIGQWQYLRVVGTAADRLKVEADTDAGGAVAGWVDADDVGISSAPPPWVRTIRTTFLFRSHGQEEFISLVPADIDLMVAGETIGRRTYVYLPGEPTSRRAGYGWIEQDAVEAARAPRDVALPSPAFRAMPLQRSGTYRVRPGDSIQLLAERSGVSGAELIRLNRLDATGRIVVGQVLHVPDPLSAVSPPGDSPRLVRETSPGRVSADYAVVVDESSGQVLWGRNANSPVAPASLTKILTSLVVLDYARLHDVVSVRVDSQRMPGSTVMGLFPREQLSVEDLLYGLMLPSGNDAALALAEHVAGTKEAFVALMNDKARALGLTGSHFANPHGLDATGHLSTAYDMAMIARAGMQDPTFRALAGARSYDSPTDSRHRFNNLNQLLWRYPGADGVKIGFTDAAGRAIVGSATREGHRVFVAMMRSTDIYADSTALLDWAFASHAWP